jgi:hypothetical protein
MLPCYCHCVCFATVESARIKSLRDASAKMSKSDADESACVLLCDSADTIVHKIRRSDQSLPANSGTAVLALADEGVHAVGLLVYSRVHAEAQDCCGTLRKYSRLSDAAGAEPRPTEAQGSLSTRPSGPRLQTSSRSSPPSTSPAALRRASQRASACRAVCCAVPCCALYAALYAAC